MTRTTIFGFWIFTYAVLEHLRTAHHLPDGRFASRGVLVELFLFIPLVELFLFIPRGAHCTLLLQPSAQGRYGLWWLSSVRHRQGALAKASLQFDISRRARAASRAVH
jgi:hypothetical protein